MRNRGKKMQIEYSKQAAKAISKINNPLNVNRQHLHNIIDVVDSQALDVLYQVLIKFIPEDEPTPDEIEAIRIGREEIRRGETVSHDDIEWN
jgi:hypothetical protein